MRGRGVGGCGVGHSRFALVGDLHGHRLLLARGRVVGYDAFQTGFGEDGRVALFFEAQGEVLKADEETEPAFSAAASSPVRLSCQGQADDHGLLAASRRGLG